MHAPCPLRLRGKAIVADDVTASCCEAIVGGSVSSHASGMQSSGAPRFWLTHFSVHLRPFARTVNTWQQPHQGSGRAKDINWAAVKNNHDRIDAKPCSLQARSMMPMVVGMAIDVQTFVLHMVEQELLDHEGIPHCLDLNPWVGDGRTQTKRLMRCTW